MAITLFSLFLIIPFAVHGTSETDFLNHKKKKKTIDRDFPESKVKCCIPPYQFLMNYDVVGPIGSPSLDTGP